MLKLAHLFKSMFVRFRYPVSLPGDVAEALGMHLCNTLSFKEFLHLLSQSPSTRLLKYMSRESAEEAFKRAVRTERFFEKTLVSYYFSEGWIEFVLQFDRESRLRRVYLLHREIPSDIGIEITLNVNNL